MSSTQPARRKAALAALIFLVASGAQLTAQKVFKDPRYGFQLRIPRDFREVPINMDEKWVVAKFLYKRPLEAKREWAERTPEMRVIVFPKVDVKQVVAARKKEEKKRISSGKGGRTVLVNLLDYLQNPFRSYHEYLRENYKKGGWFVKEEKKTKVGGLPTVFKFIEVEEKMGSGVKQSLFAWEIDVGDAIYVVQLDVLMDHDAKFKGSAKSTLSSFKKIPRTEPLRPTLTTGDTREETKAELKSKKDLTPAERRNVREADLARAIDKAKKGLPPGWKHYQHGPFEVFYVTSQRFAKRVSKQANLMWDWMHKSFNYIGEDHSVGGIIRICKDRTEAASYADTSSRSGYGLTAREIVLWDDKDWGFNDSGSGRLNFRILNQYLYDKNPRLWWALPPWLELGMDLYIGSLKMKGSKMVAAPDEWDMEVIRDCLRNDKFKNSRELLAKKWNEMKFNREEVVQCLAIIDFFMGKGNKSKKYKNLIHTYLKYLDQRVRELRKARDQRAKDSDMSDDEKKQWQSEFRRQSDKIYEDCFKKVFGDWSDSDWRNFDKAWRRSYKR